MKSISIYTITRNQNIEQLQKLERQLSGRDYFLKMREWELESMKALTAELETCMEDVYALRFFYSFQIPRLGKEFDLLQIKEDQIVNIELKSGVVSDEAYIYTMPIKYSTTMATMTTSAEMINPCSIGAMPDFFISLKLVLRPIAASAETMRNLLISFIPE